MRPITHGFAILLLLLTLTMLTACFNQQQDNGLTSLGSYPKSIAFDSQDNAYIATVKGDIFRYDGRHLSRLISRGDHGMDFAEKIRLAQDKLYIHNKRYVDRDRAYVSEVLLFSLDGEYIDRLLSSDNIETHQFRGIVVNQMGQLYSILNTVDVLRINYDRQNLIRISPEVNIDTLTDKVREVVGQFEQADIPGLSDINLLPQETPANQQGTSQTDIGGSEIRIETHQVKEFTQLTLPLLGLSHITTDAANNVYMSGMLGVFKFDQDGNYVKTLITVDDDETSLTHSLAIDPYGNIIIARYNPDNASSMHFIRFDQNGYHTGRFIISGTQSMWTSIQDIVFDGAGNFYVVDFIHGIHKFNPQGEFTGIIAKPFD